MIQAEQIDMDDFQNDETTETTGVSENLTDMGNSARFARLHSNDAKHSTKLGWRIWDARRFRADDTQQIERLARQTVQSIYAEAARATDKSERQALAEWATESESAAKINPMIRLAESEATIAVRPDVFDRDPFLLNVENGTLDLKTGALRPHSRDDLITKITPIPYDPNATCPQWYGFLDRVFNGDVGLISYVQKVCGYCLTGDTREQEFYLLHGLGANGKSTFVKTMLRVLGEYGTKSRIETFLVRKNADGSGANGDVARLAGSRMVAATESEAGQRMAESLVKTMTGGDGLTARFLYRESFEFDPQFKLILSTNHRPAIKGTDNAIWRRIRLIPFIVTIPKEEQDQELPAKLEAELPGILRWCVEGCLLWQHEGLEPPAAVVVASKSYRDDMDVLGEFLAARCELEPGSSATAKELYAGYVEWCEEQKMSDRERLSKKAFGQVLAERGLQSTRKHDGISYWDIRLRTGSV